MKNYIKYKQCTKAILFLLIITLFASCAKDATLAENPYAGGKQKLDIEFVTKTIEPEVVSAGATVDLLINGLEGYRDNFKLYVNELEAEVIHYTDSTLQFKVPELASTGSIWITSNEQTFFGPIIKIGGKVSIDASFNVGSGAGRLNGSNGATTVFDIEVKSDGNMWLGGFFNNFNNQGTEDIPNGGLVEINNMGGYVNRNSQTGGFGRGVIGGAMLVTTISRITSGDHVNKFIIGGSFTGFNSKKVNRQTLNNLAMLGTNGFLDTIFTDEIVNPKPIETGKNRDTIPRFNAGVDGLVRKTFVFEDKLYVLGGFQRFKRVYYPNSSYDDKVYDDTRMRQMVRVFLKDGAMDSTFHYNKNTGQSAVGANGSITDAIMQTDGKLILVGDFTTFNGVAAERIVRLNLDGSVDDTFGALGVGKGADGDILSIRYNATTKKIVVSGLFKNMAGKASYGVALLNSEGVPESSFTSQQIYGGSITFAAQLNNGKIIISGVFNKYGDRVRQGFAVLENTGELAEGYNNTGGFEGRIYDMHETNITGGSRVILVGNIYRFNTVFPNNVLCLNIAN